jgi:Ca2+-binding RTX toxin-like protein
MMDGVTLSGTYATSAVTENMTVGADVENIHGGAGDDVIVGNANDNVINGGPGADNMTGNGGSDTVDYSDATGPVWAQIDGIGHSGAGSFTQTLAHSSAAYTDGTCALTMSTENDTIALDFTNIIGSQGSDCLFGQPHGSACPGTTCQNNLTGGPGSDMLFGLDDDDILEGSGGLGGDGASDSNYLDCGNGTDVGHDLGVAPPGYRGNCEF